MNGDCRVGSPLVTPEFIERLRRGSQRLISHEAAIGFQFLVALCIFAAILFVFIYPISVTNIKYQNLDYIPFVVLFFVILAASIAVSSAVKLKLSRILIARLHAEMHRTSTLEIALHSSRYKQLPMRSRYALWFNVLRLFHYSPRRSIETRVDDFVYSFSVISRRCGMSIELPVMRVFRVACSALVIVPLLGTALLGVFGALSIGFQDGTAFSLMFDKLYAFLLANGDHAGLPLRWFLLIWLPLVLGGNGLQEQERLYTGSLLAVLADLLEAWQADGRLERLWNAESSAAVEDAAGLTPA